jgi:hypothetical protein
MEFVLRDYFRFRFPDLLIVALPFVHDVKHRQDDDNEIQLIRHDIEKVFNTIVKYTPPSTQVFCDIVAIINSAIWLVSLKCTIKPGTNKRLLVPD